MTLGGSVTYTITASNAGPSNAPGSTVADTFPASLTCTWTCVGAGGGTCTASSSGNISDTVNLPAGGSVTYTASCNISAAATGTLSNTSTVATAGGITDPTPASRTWTVDTVAPTGVSITAPANNASVTGQVTINATASDTVGVASVSFYVDGQLLATDSSSPFSTTWNTNKVTKTTHTLYVRAVDAAGNVTQSTTITVTVN